MFAPLLYAGHATPELRRAHAQAMSKVAAVTLRARVASILSVDYRARLRDIPVPMHYLRAASDRLVPLSALKEILRLKPAIEVVEFDAPHFLLQTLPRQGAAAVRKYL